MVFINTYTHFESPGFGSFFSTLSRIPLNILTIIDILAMTNNIGILGSSGISQEKVSSNETSYGDTSTCQIFFFRLFLGDM
jgi:hypothetical protein